jgi:hypothetical protein
LAFISIVYDTPNHFQSKPGCITLLPFQNIFNSIDDKDMNDTVNPYQSPEKEAVPEKSLVQGFLTETMLIHLKGASPWLRFIGIVGFIGTGIIVLSGILILPIARQAYSQMPGLEPFGLAATGAAFSIGMAIYCLGTGALFFFLSFYVFRFGEKIRSYLGTGMNLDLEMAFKYNRNLWKMLGILCIIGLTILPLMIIFSIIIVAYTALL